MVETAQNPSDHASEMQQMLAVIRQRGITEARVFAAMAQVPRHLFVPPEFRAYAYEDRPLSIGAGQTISQPYMVAFMTEAARLQPGNRVLEIGTGSGYQAAVLARMGAEVYSIEVLIRLARRAKRRMHSLRLTQVHIRTGDAATGWPEAEPFAAVLVTAAAPRIPDALCTQVAIGGRLIIPVGEEDGPQELQIWYRTDSELELERTLPVRFVPMVGAIREPAGNC